MVRPATTGQLVSASLAILVIKHRLLRVQKVTRTALQAVQLLVLHLVEVVKIDLAPARQLERLEELEVEQLELVVGDERGLPDVEHLFARLVDQRLREAHQGAAEHFGTLASYHILASTDNIE